MAIGLADAADEKQQPLIFRLLLFYVPHAPTPDQRGEIPSVPEPAAQEPIPLLFEIQAAVVNQEDIWRELEQREEAAPAHPLPALKQESAASYSCCDQAGPSAPVDEHPWAAADAPPLSSEHAEAEDPQTLLATKLWLKYDRNPERLLRDASDILKFIRTILTRVPVIVIRLPEPRGLSVETSTNNCHFLMIFPLLTAALSTHPDIWCQIVSRFPISSIIELAISVASIVQVREEGWTSGMRESGSIDKKEE
ncbi:hypothetical protein AAC387_Pa07g2029 [Persea americana]